MFSHNCGVEGANRLDLINSTLIRSFSDGWISESEIIKAKRAQTKKEKEQKVNESAEKELKRPSSLTGLNRTMEIRLSQIHVHAKGKKEHPELELPTEDKFFSSWSIEMDIIKKAEQERKEKHQKKIEEKKAKARLDESENLIPNVDKKMAKMRYEQEDHLMDSQDSLDPRNPITRTMVINLKDLGINNKKTHPNKARELRQMQIVSMQSLIDCAKKGKGEKTDN